MQRIYCNILRESYVTKHTFVYGNNDIFINNKYIGTCNFSESDVCLDIFTLFRFANPKHNANNKHYFSELQACELSTILNYVRAQSHPRLQTGRNLHSVSGKLVSK